jgi:hypothetical protein
MRNNPSSNNSNQSVDNKYLRLIYFLNNFIEINYNYPIFIIIKDIINSDLNEYEKQLKIEDCLLDFLKRNNFI